MEWLLSTILVGITAFAATNVDDMVITTIFFSQLSPTLRRRHIVLGKYLGFSVLLCASLPGYFGGLVISKAWIGLLGLLPIGVGVSYLLKGNADTPNLQTVSNELTLKHKASMMSFWAGLLAPQTYHVAAVTIANGGDNVGIYIPLFANSSLPRLAVIVSVFLALVGGVCWIAERLTQHPAIAQLLSRYGHRAMPFILIGLGLYIVVDSGTLHLVSSLAPLKQSLSIHWSFL